MKKKYEFTKTALDRLKEKSKDENQSKIELISQLKEEIRMKEFEKASEGIIVNENREEIEKNPILLNLLNKYQEKSNELQKVKGENKIITSYLNTIIKEIENKAPLLQKQKKQYSHCKYEKIKLSTINKKSIEQNKFLKNQIKELELRESSLIENIEKLNQQVAELLFSNQEKRANQDNGDNMEITVENQTERSTFDEIKEIQRKYQEILLKNQEYERLSELNFKEKYEKLIASFKSLENKYKSLQSRHETVLKNKDIVQNLYEELIQNNPPASNPSLPSQINPVSVPSESVSGFYPFSFFLLFFIFSSSIFILI